MKREYIVKAYVELVESYDQCQFTMNCRTPSFKRFSTSVSFDPCAPQYTPAFKRYGLFQHLCSIHGIAEQNAIDTQYRAFALKYFTFRLLEWQPGVWIIDAAGKCDPFSLEYDWSESDRLVEEMFRQLGVGGVS